MGTDDSVSIRVQGLAKRFGDVQALSAVDFDVRQGERFGFIRRRWVA